MIQSKKELVEYLEADKKAVNKNKLIGITGLYIKYLRKTEYHMNVGHSYRKRYYNTVLKVLSVISGICIPPNTFGKGLALFHYGTIIVNPSARFGCNCCIQAGVNVGDGVRGGDFVYLAPGAKINPNVKIASKVIIGSNAVLTKSIEEESVTWAGVPAKKISDKGWNPSYMG